MSQTRAGRSGAEEEPEPESREADGGEPAGGKSGHGHECLEWCPICRSHELLKGVTSPEIRQQLQSIQNEALTVFKAFAAAYTERASDDPFSRDQDRDRKGQKDSGPADQPVVTDISID